MVHRNSITLKSGFTLLELSIVLVVIGLIVGGVIGGRTLIRQSQVTSIMADSQKYIASVLAFQQKYTSLPGDMANATDYWGAAGGTVPYTTDCYASGSATSVATCNGNGDGQINYTSTHANETLRVWQHLADAGLIQGSFTGTGTASIEHVIGTNAPESRVKTGGFGLAYVGIKSAHGSFFDGNYGHVIFFGAKYASSLPATAVITGAEAQSLDTKYDDGFPALGSLRTWKNGAYSLTCASGTTASSTYSTSSTNQCSLMQLTGF